MRTYLLPRLAAVAILTGSLVGTGLPALAAARACPPAAGEQPVDAPGPVDSDVLVRGHGWGHGMGMSQYGAQGAALLGCSSSTILTTYYPGLVPQARPMGDRVMVDLLARGGSRGRAQVEARSGPVSWRSARSSVVQPQGSVWSVRSAGSTVEVRRGAEASAPVVAELATAVGGVLDARHAGVAVRTSTWSASGAPSLVRSSDGDAVRFTTGSEGLAVREVMVDDLRGTAVSKYLRGLAEMPVSWPVAAQEAQVVAARTFLAGKWSATERAYVVRPTTSDQVWTGLDRQQEDAKYGGRLASAVAGTSTASGGVVMVTTTGVLARDLLYASSHGGYSESNRYVWGSAQVAHLVPVDDSRWEAASSDPNRSWTVGLRWEQVARAFGLTTASDIEVAPRGSSGRTTVVVTGTRDGVPVVLRVTGQQARDRLATVDDRVRSSGFTFGVRGLVGGRPVSGDWDGDGTDEVGWFTDGRWRVRDRAGVTRTFAFGSRGDVPVVGDWDGDGVDGVGVFRSGRWHLRQDATGGRADLVVGFGSRGDVPVTGAWARSGVDGLGVVRGSRWHLRDTPTTGVATRTWDFGRAADAAVPGDWDGDGVDGPGRVSAGVWYLGDGRSAKAASVVAMGSPGDLFVAGSWDGGRADTPAAARGGQFRLQSGQNGLITWRVAE